MAKLFDIMGKFPFAPDDKKPMLIRKQDYSTALYPPDNAFTSDNTERLEVRQVKERLLRLAYIQEELQGWGD